MGTKRSKTLPRIQNTSKNPKTHPRIQNTYQKPKTHRRSQNTSQNPKHVWILGSVFEFSEVFWILGSVFGFWEVFLDSGKCFWIPGKCFWIPGTYFVPYEPPYYLEDVDQQARKRREVSNRTQVTWISQSKAKSKLMYLARREFLFGLCVTSGKNSVSWFQNYRSWFSIEKSPAWSSFLGS